MEVFDRGGYSKKFCVEIPDRIRFICWRSDARSLPKGIEIADWAEVKIEHQGNNYVQVISLRVVFEEVISGIACGWEACGLVISVFML